MSVFNSAQILIAIGFGILVGDLLEVGHSQIAVGLILVASAAYLAFITKELFKKQEPPELEIELLNEILKYHKEQIEYTKVFFSKVLDDLESKAK